MGTIELHQNKRINLRERAFCYRVDKENTVTTEAVSDGDGQTGGETAAKTEKFWRRTKAQP